MSPASERNGFRSNPSNIIAVAIIAVIALIGVGAFVGLLLSDGSEGKLDTDVRIVAPQEGDTLDRPFVLKVESPTFRIADPLQEIPDAAHFHAFVDVHPFTPAGQVIPNADGIYHFSDNNLTLDLPPGEHRIIVVLGDNNDVRIPDATVTAITVFVQ